MTPAASLLEAPVHCSSVNENQSHTYFGVFEEPTPATPLTAFWEEAAEYATTAPFSPVSTAIKETAM
jgi:hypothetical protein